MPVVLKLNVQELFWCAFEFLQTKSSLISYTYIVHFFAHLHHKGSKQKATRWNKYSDRFRPENMTQHSSRLFFSSLASMYASRHSARIHEDVQLRAAFTRSAKSWHSRTPRIAFIGRESLVPPQSKTWKKLYSKFGWQKRAHCVMLHNTK